METIIDGGTMNDDLLTNELHSVDAQDDVGVLRGMVERYSDYSMMLVQKFREQTAMGAVQDEVPDHMHAVTELLTRALTQL